MGNYILENDTYIIKDYDKMPPFTSFLPGLSGIRGIPMWLFYVNRGQGIASFGIHNKGNAIMEFNPANTGYENTAVKGFRTFIRIDESYYEPFINYNCSTERNMYIKKNSLEVEEINHEIKLSIKAKYFILPNEEIGAVVRNIIITDLSGHRRDIEVLDGMPKIIPFGISNSSYKDVSNLLKSWTDIRNIENDIPFITMRSSSNDSAEVTEVKSGYYYLSVKDGKLIMPIYDIEAVFDYDTSLLRPVIFEKEGLSGVLKFKQYYVNKIPCAFTPISEVLEGNGHISFTSYVGYAGDVSQINKMSSVFSKIGYEIEKRKEADCLAEQFTKDIHTHTAYPVFDQYMKQSYLDNFLRGGYPFVFGKDNNKKVLHLFSRKHGDPERDYNFFTIAGEYYSQGNGNFRDVCQNRRNDIFFNKEIDDYNIKVFAELIQADGYNPLEVRPSSFTLKDSEKDKVYDYVSKACTEGADKLSIVINKKYTPGLISSCIALNHIELSIPEEELITEILNSSEQHTEAGFGEGYWSDHFDYVLDLIESYEKIYPDRMNDLLFDKHDYRFYDSPCYVLPRSEKYVMAKLGVRQYGAEIFDEEKCKREGFIRNGTNWLKDEHGNEIKTSLIVKLVSLALNKFSLLDPYGMGIEMEGGKPGWNDAMNGLPGLFGSGMAETFELKRLLMFIKRYLSPNGYIMVPCQIYKLLMSVEESLQLHFLDTYDNFEYWDNVAIAREKYRKETRFTLTSGCNTLTKMELVEIIDNFLDKLETGISRALLIGEGIMPTYFTYKAEEYTVSEEKTHYGLCRAKVTKFSVMPLPLFLEGPARMLTTGTDIDTARSMYKKVKASGIYDKELMMYKTSEPIEHISMENGRIKAFTPGWLERESIFLHMEYKYLFALLKSELYEEYYEDIKTALIPFLKPEVYGRSIMENSSFIASSENPDPKVRGRGYVSRLSGSTTEAISMWILMFAGSKLFTYEKGELVLKLEPKLPEYFFDENDEASFTLLSDCLVTYHNPSRKATFGKDKASILSISSDNETYKVSGGIIRGMFAEAVRNNEIKRLYVEIG